MKKTILSIAFMAAAIFAASCQKENLQENTASEGSASVFTATIESVAGTKTTVERVDGTPVVYKTKWDDGDMISINGTIFTATPALDATKTTFTKDSGNDPTGTYKAYFPKELCKKMKGLIVSLPESYTYAEGKYNMPMYAESTTTSLSFKNLCGVLAITVKGSDFTSVNSIEVSSDQQMNGRFNATAEGVLSFESVTLTDDNKKVTLNFEPAKTIASDGSATFYIPVPPATNHTLTIKVTDGSTTKTMVTKKSGGVAVKRNMIYPIVFADNSLVTGALPGVFSVSATKKVHFSKGNLWADGSNALHFEANQYSSASSWDATHVSHFSWSSTVEAAVGDTNSGDNLFCDESHKVSVDGGEAIYYALSKDEWIYLFDHHSKKWATVNGVNGYVIAPDDFSGELSATYTDDAALATNNLVFLPAAGFRYGSRTIDVGTYGYYWSSTAYDGNNTYYVLFNSSIVYPDNYDSRFYDRNVRLVTDASASKKETVTTMVIISDFSITSVEDTYTAEPVTFVSSNTPDGKKWAVDSNSSSWTNPADKTDNFSFTKRIKSGSKTDFDKRGPYFEIPVAKGATIELWFKSGGVGNVRKVNMLDGTFSDSATVLETASNNGTALGYHSFTYNGSTGKAVFTVDNGGVNFYGIRITTTK